MGFFNRIHRKLNPELFQGVGKKKQYFEGWYFKVVNAKRDKAFAFIPGIAYDKAGEGHAFIQVLDGIQKTASYHRFDAALFEVHTQLFQFGS